MAPLPTLPGVYYCRINALSDGKPVSNIFVFKNDVPPTSEAQDATWSSYVASSVASNWSSVATYLLHQDYTAYDVQCYPLGHPTLPAFVSAFTATGGNTSTQSFRQIAGEVKHNVYRRGKGSQGRTLLSPIGADQLETDGDNLIDAWVTSAQTHFPSFITNTLIQIESLVTGSWDYVQLSRLGSGATYPVVNSTPQKLVRSQNRRR